jgi:hypothetical protein
MTEQYLYRAKVAGGLVDDGYLFPAKRMGAILLTAQTDSADPLIDESRVLPRTEVINPIDTAWEDIVWQCAASPLQPGKQASSCVCQQLELNRPTGLLLHDNRTGADLPASNQVTDSNTYRVAAT